MPTGISWADETWNPIISGCTKISEGCDNCYAEKMAIRLQGMGQPKYKNAFRLTIHQDREKHDLYGKGSPQRKKQPKLYFVGSMYDIGHGKIPYDYVYDIVQAAKEFDWHYFLFLTKRPKRLVELQEWFGGYLWDAPNIGVGVTVELAKYTHRLDDLRKINAQMRFVSAEPLLGTTHHLDYTNIDWIISGGESGTNFRTPDLQWFRKLKQMCVTNRIAFHHKQNGGNSFCECKDHKPAKGCRLIGDKIYDGYPIQIENVLGGSE